MRGEADRLLRKAELDLAAARSVVEVLARCGPSSKRFPAAEHAAAIDRAERAVIDAMLRQASLAARLSGARSR